MHNQEGYDRRYYIKEANPTFSETVRTWDLCSNNEPSQSEP